MSAGFDASREAHEVRQSLQTADYLVQCGDSARAADLYLRLAARYAERRRTQEAVAICYRALHVHAAQFVDVAAGDIVRRLGRAGAAVCTHAADLHKMQGRWGDALRMYQLAAELDPNDAIAAVRVAEVLLEQHAYPHAVGALFEAGQRLLRDGNNADFLHVAEQILLIDPRHAATLRDLARTHVRLGEPHRAVDRLAQLMRVCPEDPAGYEILAQAFASIGRIPKALSILTRLVHDQRRAGNEPAAQALLDRAQWWSRDAVFGGAIAAIRKPVQPQRHASARPAREATVMLSIDDIVVEVEEERDLGGTLVLALEDIAFVEASRRMRAPARPAGAPPPLPRRAPSKPMPAVEAAPAKPIAKTPHIPPRRVRRPTPVRIHQPGTIVLDASDLIEDDDPPTIDDGPMMDQELRALAALAQDEDSGAKDAVDDEATTAVRRRPAPPLAPPTARAGARGSAVPHRVPKAPTSKLERVPRRAR